LIIVYHLSNKIMEVITSENQIIEFDCNGSIAFGLNKLAEDFPEEKIIWCSSCFKEILNLKIIDTVFHHNKMLLSYGPADNNYLGREIGYIEESPFIKINKKKTYPTWQMSSVVGVIHASVLLEVKDKIKMDTDFDYYLNSVAKVCLPLGLLCYSEPDLLQQHQQTSISNQSSIYTLFKFVKQHYKTRWVFLLFVNLMIYERKFLLFPFFLSLFYKNRNSGLISLKEIRVQSSRKVIAKGTIDVIIPTIGRKKYLYDVLKDLAQQTHLPKNVIIVEQNPLTNSLSELDFLTSESWPFSIKHSFTNYPGACNARNIALKEIISEWVFLADDDIRIKNDFIQKTLENIKELGVTAVSIRCLQKEEKQSSGAVFQWGSFGSGCSFVASKSVKDCIFTIGYEFGFGEDADFGMQLRNQGSDILYLPKPEILHLKAPIGGFRIKPVLRWDNESIQPKPSPTVMLYKISHNSQEQLLGYKMISMFKYYRYQKIKNPIKYLKNYKKQWGKSVFLASELKKTA
jgi:GT2 family glycosyltransferase